MALVSMHDVNYLLRLGMRILPQPVTHAANGLIQTFLACSRFWLLFYALWLLVMDMFFTIFPTTLIFVTGMSLILHYTRLHPPPDQFVHAVLGTDPSLTIRDPSNDPLTVVVPFLSDALTKIASTTVDAAIQTGVNLLDSDSRNPQNVLNLAAQQLGMSLNKGVGTAAAAAGFNTPIPDPVLESAVVLDQGPAVIARRGAGWDAPENSLAAFEQCKRSGCRFVQFDVTLTKDNVPVVFHDADLIRMAGKNVKVNLLRAEDIRKVVLSDAYHSSRLIKGESVPDLDSAVDKCIELNLKFVMNVMNPAWAMIQAICNAYKRNRTMYTMAIVMSFHWKVIYSIRKIDPKILGCIGTPTENRLNLATEAIAAVQNNMRSSQWTGTQLVEWFTATYLNFGDWMIENFLWWYLGLSAIFIKKDLVCQNTVTEWKTRGIHVFLWPVNASAEKIYYHQILRVGYLTDTVVNDPILKPHSQNSTGLVPGSGELQPSSKHHHEQMDNLTDKDYSPLTQENSRMSMYSIPASPVLSLDNTSTWRTLNSAAQGLEQEGVPLKQKSKRIDFAGGTSPVNFPKTESSSSRDKSRGSSGVAGVDPRKIISVYPNRRKPAK